MRVPHTAMFVTLLLITLSLVAPAIPAAEIQEAAAAAAMPVNDTLLYTVAAHGPSAPLSSFEKQEEITLFRFELNQTTFPGPRSMAIGPRYIELKVSPASLVIVILVLAGLGVSGIMMHMRGKAGEDDGDNAEKENGNEVEKGDRR